MADTSFRSAARPGWFLPLWLLIAAFFVYHLGDALRSDFWEDEARCLVSFIVPSVDHVFARSSNSTNNHILYSLTSSLYLKALGIRDVLPLTDAPLIIRLPSLLFSLLTLWLTARIGARFFHPTVGLIAALLLSTCPAFFHFAVQIRGYALEILLFTWMVEQALAFDAEGKKWQLLRATLAAFLAMLSLPSILYGIVATSLCFLVDGLIAEFRRIEHRFRWKPADLCGWKNTLAFQLKERRSLVLSLMLLLGAGATGCLYILYIEIYFGYSQELHVLDFATRLQALTTRLPEALNAFFAGRWALAVIAPAGLILWKRNLPPSSPIPRRLLLLAILFLIPFCLTFAHGVGTRNRDYLNLAPIFSVLLAVGVAPLFRMSQMDKRGLAILASLILLVYCQVKFTAEIRHSKEELDQALAAGQRQQDDYRLNFYQHRFYPDRLVREFVPEYQNAPKPLLIFFRSDFCVRLYLDKYKIPYLDPRTAETFREWVPQYTSFYVLSQFPDSLPHILANEFPEYRCRRINAEGGFYNLYAFEKTGAACDKDRSSSGVLLTGNGR